ncbi:MAG: UDP-N-acetylglucosamine 1-carboxyvinyltransferase [Polyangiales bacterium]
MDSIRVEGGVALCGEVPISGAKNAVLPALCATLLASGRHTLSHVPMLRDVRTTRALLEHLGCRVEREADRLEVEVGASIHSEAPYALVKKMRASILVLGPLVARLGRARVSLPGGCAIGARPIDQHLKGLKAMGATVHLAHGYVQVEVPRGRLRGADIRFATPTVTGTENLLCAAALAVGRTRLIGAAREPEVQDLGRALQQMGAKISGLGTDLITIDGVEGLTPMQHRVIPDRIEAGTFAVAAALTGGEVVLQGVRACDLDAVSAKLREAGVEIAMDGENMQVRGRPPFRATDLSTAPFPGFPTDMQAQFMVLMCRAEGRSALTETIFENRFMHVPELGRMGADIRVEGRTAMINGVASLQGAPVMATDLRASASLLLAALVAEGESELRRVYHIDRGYERIEAKLSALGARVCRVVGDA